MDNTWWTDFSAEDVFVLGDEHIYLPPSYESNYIEASEIDGLIIWLMKCKEELNGE